MDYNGLKLSPVELARIPDGLRQRVVALQEALHQAGWRPISEAPKNATPVDLWCASWFQPYITRMRRVELSKDNVFYEPIDAGPSCVRDATHFRIIMGPVPK